MLTNLMLPNQIPTKRLSTHLAIIALSLVTFAVHAGARDVRVLNFDPVIIDFQAPQATAQLKPATATTMKFSAFGKAFSATLQANTGITLPPATRAQVYRGSIDGREHSWVRVTRIGQEVHGLIFDGVELFAIEPAASIGTDAAQGTAIFRLADTRTDLDAEFCAALKTTGESSGLAIYQSLNGESKAILAQMQKAGARMRLQLSAVYDLAFRNRYGSDVEANDAIVARINNVDGIFSGQLGIEVQLVTTVAPEAPNSLLFNSTVPDTMLQTLAKLRSETPVLYATGVTHLFTGADLDGKTVGIAYMDAVCGQRYAASLGEARDRGAWFDSLVAAHELGHTFGSPHDGEGECASTPSTIYLMAPTITGSDRFSQCSLNHIQTRIPTASCLIPIPVSDISVPSLGEYHAPVSTEFSWSMAVANIGNADALDAKVQIVLPPTLTVSAARIDGGSCAIGGGAVTCDLGTLAMHDTRIVELTIKGDQSGAYTITSTVSARTDSDSSNNVGTGTIRVDPSVDAGITLSAPTTATIDQSFAATFVVTNKSAATAANVFVDIVVPVGLTITGTPLFDGGACQMQFQVLRCSAADFTAGRTLSGSLVLVARESGTQTLTASLDGSFSDPQPLDNAAQKSIVVSGPAVAATASAPQSNQASGGGASNVYLLMTLGGLLLLSRRSRLARN
jgi:hypothetical protein